MATGTVLLSPASAIIPDGSSGNGAAGLSRRQGTETNPKKHILTLDFDGGGAVEHAWWAFRMPANYASGGTLKVQWMGNATSGDVKWQARVGAVTPADADTPIEHAQAAAATTTTTVNATEARRLMETSISLTMDSAAAGDWISLVLFRDSGDAADTMTVDAEVTAVAFEYTTT